MPSKLHLQYQQETREAYEGRMARLKLLAEERAENIEEYTKRAARRLPLGSYLMEAR